MKSGEEPTQLNSGGGEIIDEFYVTFRNTFVGVGLLVLIPSLDVCDLSIMGFLSVWDTILDIFVISVPLISRPCSTGSPKLRCFLKSLWRHILYRRWASKPEARGGGLTPETSSVAGENRRPRRTHQLCD